MTDRDHTEGGDAGHGEAPSPVPTPEWATWDPPWDGVSAKFAHACWQFATLAVNTKQFIKRPPITVVTAAAPERGPNWLQMELDVQHPGTVIALWFGDFLHNLRCALDHSLTAIDPRAGKRALCSRSRRRRRNSISGRRISATTEAAKS